LITQIQVIKLYWKLAFKKDFLAYFFRFPASYFLHRLDREKRYTRMGALYPDFTFNVSSYIFTDSPEYRETAKRVKEKNKFYGYLEYSHPSQVGDVRSGREFPVETSSFDGHPKKHVK